MPKPCFDYPEGSIQSIDQLNDVLKQGAGTVLYYVHGLGKSSGTSVYRTTNLTKVKDNFVEGVHFDDYPAFTHFSLRDCNVADRNQYNDHFLFETKAWADAYLEQCKNSQEQEDAAQEHFKYVDSLESIFRRVFAV